MILRPTAWMIVLLLNVCSSFHVLRAQVLSRPGNRVITGVVVSASSGRPIEGADVIIQDTRNSNQSAQTVTDNAGRFSFQNVPDGKYILSASHRGFARTAFDEHDGPLTAIVTGEGLDATGIRLALAPLGAIFGTTTEDSGDPVPHARLTLFRIVHSGGIDRQVIAGQGEADDMGNFELAHLMAGDYLLCVSGIPWYRPAPAVRVQESPQERSPLDMAYSLNCYPDTADPLAAEPIALRAGERLQTNLTLHPVRAMHLFFKVPRPDPTAGIAMPQLRRSIFGFLEPVMSEMFVAPGQMRSEAVSGQATIEISGLAPGRYSLEYPDTDHKSTEQLGDSRKLRQIEISSSDLSVDAASLEPMATISGKLLSTRGENPPSDSQILLLAQDGPSPRAGPVGKDGEFNIPSVPPGNYRLLVRSGSLVLPPTQLKVSGNPVKGNMLNVGNDALVLTMTTSTHTSSVMGLVTRTGKPSAGVFAVIVPVDSTANYDYVNPNQSDSDGTVTFDNVTPGQYIAVAIVEGWKLAWRHPEVLAPFLAKGVRITIDSTRNEFELKAPLEAQTISAVQVR